MSDNKTLMPVEQKTVEFYGDEVTAVRLKDGRVFVPVKPICELLGVDWNGQRRRINRDPVMSVSMATVDVTSTEGERVVARAVLCLPLDYVSGFLFGLNADRVRPDLREKVIRYQQECYKVLAEAFTDGRLTADPSFEELLTQVDNPAVQAYQIAKAIMRLSQNQILMEARLSGRIDNHEERLEAIESQLAPPAHAVSQSQAMQISQAVKAVGIALGKKTGKNEFGGVYGELYRKYEITSYKLLPAVKFETVMKWLTEWYQSLTNEADLPF